MKETILSTLHTRNGDVRIVNRRISAHDYIEFLTRTDLGSQYPRERFHERIAKLVSSVPISLLAVAGDGRIVGVCFGLSDFSYWLMVTDLGIDREYVTCGIGSELIALARSEAGGRENIIVFIYANEAAVPFYEKNGLQKSGSMMELTDVEWTGFTVTKEMLPG